MHAKLIFKKNINLKKKEKKMVYHNKTKLNHKRKRVGNHTVI